MTNKEGRDRIVVVIQARMASTRLPGKVLEDIGGASMLARTVRRCQRSRLATVVVVATGDASSDQAIVEEGKRLGVEVYRGPERDVLERYGQVAQWTKAEIVVRVTADCPLISAEVIDHTVTAFLHARPDYASNILERSFPRGLDTEVIARHALMAARALATQPHEREHVTPYIYEHPERFRLLSVTADHDFSDHRWTVDTILDLELVRRIYAAFDGDDRFGWRDVLAVLEQRPELRFLNRGVQQKALKD
jgi:spore coat polysaccharide biosynthesis protein SpsF